MDLQQDHIKCESLGSSFHFQFEQLLSLWAAYGIVQGFLKLVWSTFIGIGPLSNLEKIYSFHAGHFLLDKEVKKKKKYEFPGTWWTRSVCACGGELSLQLPEPGWSEERPLLISSCSLRVSFWLMETVFLGISLWFCSVRCSELAPWQLPLLFLVSQKASGTPQKKAKDACSCLQQDIAVASRLWERLAVILYGSKKKSLGSMKPFRLQVSTSAERKWERNPVAVQFLHSTGCLILEQHQHRFWLLLETGAWGGVSHVGLPPFIHN